MSDLREKFYTAVPLIENQMYDEVVKSGYYRASPQSTRRRWTGIGILLTIVAALSAGFLLVCD